MKPVLSIGFYAFLICLTCGCSQPYLILNATEQWIVNQLTAGKLADLSKFSDDETERAVRGDALSAIITKDVTRGGVPVQYTSDIHISNAVIKGDVELIARSIAHVLALKDCRFEDKFVAERTTFEKLVVFDGSSFNEVDFRLAEFRGPLYATKAKFHGPVFLDTTKVRSAAVFREAEFLDSENKVSFNAMSAGFLIFDGASFAGSVDFVGANCGGQLQMQNCRFTSPEKDVSFARMTVVDGILLTGTTFAGPLLFNVCTPAFLDARKIKCLSEKHAANFAEMRVGEWAVFRGAEFAGPVSFVRAEVGDALNLFGALFRSSEAEADFYHMKVKGDLLLNKVGFAGSVDLV